VHKKNTRLYHYYYNNIIITVRTRGGEYIFGGSFLGLAFRTEFRRRRRTQAPHAHYCYRHYRTQHRLTADQRAHTSFIIYHVSRASV